MPKKVNFLHDSLAEIKNERLYSTTDMNDLKNKSDLLEHLESS